jgi:signal transduction histidine kinase
VTVRADRLGTSEPGPTVVPDATSRRQQGQLLSSVCHDLGTPLASILMGAGFLRRVLPAEEAAALRVVDTIHRAAGRMNRLIASFGDLARLRTGELTLERRIHDVAAMAGEACARFAPEASAQGVAFSLECLPAEGVLVTCDGERLVQSLQLVALCALRVVPDGGTIAVRATVVADALVRFDVEARRGAAPTSRRITGELPKPELAIARGMIELHGAQLAIALDEDRLEMSWSLRREPPAPR